jgi:hypothetical protein
MSESTVIRCQHARADCRKQQVQLTLREVCLPDVEAFTTPPVSKLTPVGSRECRSRSARTARRALQDRVGWVLVLRLFESTSPSHASFQ